MEENLKRSAWVASPVSNKIGTVLFALSAVMFILCFSNWMGMFSALKGLASMGSSIEEIEEIEKMRGGFMKAGLIIFLPFFILHAILSVGMFLGYNACTAITKSYGISVLILDIVSIIACVIAIYCIIPLIASSLGISGELLGNIGGMLDFDKFKDLANSVDKDTIKEYEEATKEIASSISGMFDNYKDIASSLDANTIKQFEEATKEVAKLGANAINEHPELVSSIYEQYSGAVKEIYEQYPDLVSETVTETAKIAKEVYGEILGDIGPEIVAGAKAFAKFWVCCVKIILFLVLSQVFTIIAALLVKINNAKKARLVALILCLFTWGVGGHLLYVGRTGKAVIRIILNVTLILAIIPIILTIVDFFKIIAGKFIDKEKQPVLEWV